MLIVPMGHERAAKHVLLPSPLLQTLIASQQGVMTLTLVFTHLRLTFEDQSALLQLAISLMSLALYVINLRLLWQN
jgi:hypothetical protein